MSSKKIKILFIASDDNNVFPRLYEKKTDCQMHPCWLQYVIQENNVRYITREIVNNET